MARPHEGREKEIRSVMAGRIFRASCTARSVGNAIIEIGQAEWPRRHDIRAFHPERHVLSFSLTPPTQPSHISYEGIWPRGQFAAIGKVALFPSGMPFVGRYAGGPQSLLCCRIPRRHFDGLAGHRGDWSARQLLAATDLSSNLSIRMNLQRLAEEVLAPGLASEALIESLLATVLVDVVRHIERPGISENRAGKLAAWQMRRIEERLADLAAGTPSLAELAASCDIGARQLMRAFKATTGKTVHEHVSALQLVQARALLAETDLPLKRIALQLGYRQPASFSVAFRRACGETPSSFRSRQQKNRAPRANP